MEELINYFVYDDMLSMRSVAFLFVMLVAVEIIFNMLVMAKQSSKM